MTFLKNNFLHIDFLLKTSCLAGIVMIGGGWEWVIIWCTWCVGEWLKNESYREIFKQAFRIKGDYGLCCVALYGVMSIGLLIQGDHGEEWWLHMQKRGGGLILSSIVEELWFRGYCLLALNQEGGRKGIKACLMSLGCFFLLHEPWKVGWWPHMGTFMLGMINTVNIGWHRRIGSSIGLHIMGNCMGEVWGRFLGDYSKFFFF